MSLRDSRVPQDMYRVSRLQQSTSGTGTQSFAWLLTIFYNNSLSLSFSASSADNYLLFTFAG